MGEEFPTFGEDKWAGRAGIGSKPNLFLEPRDATAHDLYISFQLRRSLYLRCSKRDDRDTKLLVAFLRRLKDYDPYDDQITYQR